MSHRDVPSFVRGYARTWIHALAVAAMTALGTLTVVHRGFAVLAIAAYLLPPVVLYVTGAGPVRSWSPTEAADDAGRTPGTARADDVGESRDAGPVADTGAVEETRGAAGRPADVDDDADQDEGTPDGWAPVDVPTDATLHDVALAGGRAVAVGEGGLVVADGDGWDTILETGPGADANTLRGASATGDGDAVWFAGDGGALGRLEVGSGRHVDHSAPADVTDTWTDVAAAGGAGDETVLLVNGSGEVLRGRYRGGDLAWDDPVTPGSGSSLSGATLATPEVGHLCDTNDGVFETADGRSFRTVGVDADGTLTDVATGGRGDCLVGADDGVLHRYDGTAWTPVDLADGPLHAVARAGGMAVACGADALFERPAPDAGWTRTLVPAAGDLRGVAVGPSRAIAVGERGAAVVRDR